MKINGVNLYSPKCRFRCCFCKEEKAEVPSVCLSCGELSSEATVDCSGVSGVDEVHEVIATINATYSIFVVMVTVRPETMLLLAVAGSSKVDATSSKIFGVDVLLAGPDNSLGVWDEINFQK